MTAVLSWHVQKFVGIWWFEMEVNFCTNHNVLQWSQLCPPLTYEAFWLIHLEADSPFPARGSPGGYPMQLQWPSATMNNGYAARIPLGHISLMILTSNLILLCSSQSLMQWSLPNFAYAMTAQLSWHVQKFVEIWWFKMEVNFCLIARIMISSI